MTSASTSATSRPRTVTSSSPCPPAEVAGDGPQGAMDEDADGALGAAEDAGDLGGAHLVDEAQHDRPPAVCRQAADGAPGGRGLVAGGPSRPRRRAGSATIAPVASSSTAAGWRRADRRSFATTFRAIRKSQTGMSSALAVRRPGPLIEPLQVREGCQERPLRWRPRRRDGRRARSRRSCTPGQGTADRGRRTAPGRAGPPPRGAGRGPGGRSGRGRCCRSRISRTPAEPSCYTAPADGIRRWVTSPARTARSRPGSGPRSPRPEGPRGAVDARRADQLGSAGRPLEPDDPAGRHLALGPARHVEPSPAERVEPGLQPGEERHEERLAVDRPAAADLAEGRHRAGEIRRGMPRPATPR